MNRKLPALGYVVSAVSLVSLALPPSATAQTRTSQPNPKLPLERYDMPPAYIYRLERSPRMISPYGVFTSYQANVDANGNNIVRRRGERASNRRQSDRRQQDGNRLEAIRQRFIQLSASRLGVHHRCRHNMEFPRCSGRQRFPQRPCVILG